MTKLRNIELNLLDFKGAVDRRFNEITEEMPGRLTRNLQEAEEREKMLAKDVG